MISRHFTTLFAVLFWASAAPGAFAQPTLTVEKHSYCGSDSGNCLRRIDVIHINPEHFRTTVNSAAKRETSKEGGARVFFDNLLNYATSSDAIAVISGGFIRQINPLTP